MYSIKWRQKVLSDLRKLPKSIAQRIVKKVDTARSNPHHFLERLSADSGYKIRVGDYRVIIDILESEELLVVRVVGHRKNIYK
jgi:mRNA interferase RelE/StbE